MYIKQLFVSIDGRNGLLSVYILELHHVYLVSIEYLDATSKRTVSKEQQNVYFTETRLMSTPGASGWKSVTRRWVERYFSWIFAELLFCTELNKINSFLEFKQLLQMCRFVPHIIFVYIEQISNPRKCEKAKKRW